MSKTPAHVIAASALALLLSACGSDTQGTSSGGGGGEKALPPRSDGRELADWAAVTFLHKKSTEICAVGTESLAKTFGKEGWCESNNDFKQTPVTLKVRGTCDTREQGGPIAPGDLYLYVVDPSVQFTSAKDTDNALIVIVNDNAGKWSVTDLYVKSTDPADPKAGACPSGGLKSLDESVTLKD